MNFLNARLKEVKLSKMTVLNQIASVNSRFYVKTEVRA